VTDSWTFQKLRDIADIRVSNVDKKTHRSEKPAKLCNYMDVYSNEYITNDIQFMEASANSAEIENFSLIVGDVVITKDSETPDDIGIPAVIAIATLLRTFLVVYFACCQKCPCPNLCGGSYIYEKIDNLVCGYHLAIIRPDKNKLDSVFLSKCLSTSHIAKYFALHASGSTRFGLPIGAIELAEIPTPPKTEQTQIASILSTIDRAIEQTEAIIAKQQRIKTGLMQDLLTKGIDEDGNVRSEATHEFKDSPLGRIPAEWEVAPVGKYGSKHKSYLRTGPFGSDLNTNHWVEVGVPVLTIGSLGEGEVIEEELLYVGSFTAKGLQGFLVEPGDIVISRVADIGRSLVIETQQSGWIISSNLMRLSLNQDVANPMHLYRNISFNSHVRNQLRVTSNSGGRDLVNGAILSKILIPWPSFEEQNRIDRTLNHLDNKISILKEQLIKQNSQKVGLMQDLLTGNVRVTALLNDQEIAKI